MVITDVNEFVGKLHGRVPVILEPEQFGPWPEGKAGVEVLKPAANDALQRWPVSRRVKGSRAPFLDAEGEMRARYRHRSSPLKPQVAAQAVVALAA